MSNRRISFALILMALILLLSACSNKEEQQAVEAVETAISAINMDDLDAPAAIENARTLYDGLEDKLKEKVQNYQALTDAEAKLSDLRKEALDGMRTVLDTGISQCAMLRDVVVQVWGEAIHSKYGDFNAALQALYSGKDYFVAGLSKELASTFKDGISLLNENYALIEKQLKIVKDLGVDSDVYSAISGVFTEYTVFYNQIISPSGSYTSYSSDTNDTYNDVLRAVTNLELVWPY